MEKYLEDYPAVMNVEEVARILGCTQNTVRTLIKDKQLGAVRVGRHYRIPKDRLVKFLGGVA